MSKTVGPYRLYPRGDYNLPLIRYTRCLIWYQTGADHLSI